MYSFKNRLRQENFTVMWNVKTKYFLTDILLPEKLSIKLVWRKIVWLVITYSLKIRSNFNMFFYKLLF